MGSKIPGGGGEVKLNRKGIRELLNSEAIYRELEKRMKRVQAALPGSEMQRKRRPTRAAVIVIRGSAYDEANTGHLSRALDLAQGERGTKIRPSKPKRGA